MAELQQRYGLEYVLMIDSEPHLRANPDEGVYTAGSIGKMMPFVYARGMLSHAGISHEGFNPLVILGDVMRRTEMNPDLAEVHPITGQISPMPTWLMARDSKTIYDVSMPLSAFGFLNILAFTNRAAAVMSALEAICRTSAAEMTAQVNRGIETFYHYNGPAPCPARWQTRVMTYEAYLAQQKEARGEAFEAWYQQMTGDVVASVYRGEQTSASATWAILDRLTDMDGAHQPLVILGWVPPFYPSVCYLDRPDYSAAIQQLWGHLNRISEEEWGQKYDLAAYIMGVSDLSFSSLPQGEETGQVVAANMPLFDRTFTIPFRQIGQISMPCINIGPWGKDVHRLTERVFRTDLFERTPRLLRAAIQTALQWK